MDESLSTRVGLDTSRASPALRAAVEAGASTLRLTGRRSGTRSIRFREMTEAAALATFGALGRVRLENRGELDMMVQASGIATWLVVEGDLAGQSPEPDDGTRVAA